jgi:hypothetical protein
MALRPNTIFKEKTMTTKQFKSKAERLAAMKKRLAETETSAGSSGFLSVKEGVTIVRILPEPDGSEMDFFYQEVGIHVLPGKEEKRVYCPKFTSRGEKDCPICEVVDQLYRSGDSSSKALAGQLRVQKKYWMNVIERSDEASGPKIWTAGVLAFQQVMGLINDPDFGDITDPGDGCDIKINREGTGKNDTKYSIQARRPSALGTDEQVEKWLSSARDLSWVEVSDNPDEDQGLSEGHAVYILPYGRLVDECGLDDLGDGSDVDEDDEEDRAPQKSQPRKLAAKAVRKSAAKVDEDDDEQDDDDDEEEGYEPRPTARRSNRR